MARAVEQLHAGFQSWRAVTLAPLRHKMFSLLLGATMVSYFGAVVQTVAAAWLMATLVEVPAWVAYVQAAALAPFVLLALPAGALADIGDRRILMLGAQFFGAAASIGLVVIAFLGALSPTVLIGFTFLIGCAAALGNPAWQAAVGDLVDRQTLPAAISLNALAYNIARSVGPAIGGLVVAASGAIGAFALNALSYIGLIAVLLTWRSAPKRNCELPPEPIGAAVLSGVRYALLSPRLIALYARGALFGLGASSVVALLPFIARDQLGGGPLTYGLLLGGFGFGSMCATLVIAPLRRILSVQRLVGICTAAFAVSTLVLSVSEAIHFSVLALAVAGGAWITALAAIATSVQLSCPRWVVGRCVAMGQVATLGGLTSGSIIWGSLANVTGFATALLISAVSLFASLLAARLWKIADTDNLDWSTAAPIVPAPGLDLDPRSGPVSVSIQYKVAPHHAEAFLAAMYELGRIRQRDGARRWSIAQSIDDPTVWQERYENSTWIELLRRASRSIAADKAARDRALAFHEGPPPRVERLLERPPGAVALDAD